jgi:hypothetical protein
VRKILDVAIAAMQPLPAGTNTIPQWKPIETVPELQDGRYVFATWVNNGAVRRLRFRDGEWTDKHGDKFWTPTHLMPMPAPPK